MQRRFYRQLTWIWIPALMLACAGLPQADDAVPLISPAELNARLDDPGLLILDVRRSNDWTRSPSMIKGAVHVRPESYPAWAERYPKDRQIVLYCA